MSSRDWPPMMCCEFQFTSCVIPILTSSADLNASSFLHWHCVVCALDFITTAIPLEHLQFCQCHPRFGALQCYTLL